MASGEEEEVVSIISNKQVVLRDHHVTGYLKESDMCMSISTITLKVPHNSKGVLVKNLYLSCDPYIRGHTTSIQGAYADQYFKTGSVSILNPILSFFFSFYCCGCVSNMD